MKRTKYFKMPPAHQMYMTRILPEVHLMPLPETASSSLASAVAPPVVPAAASSPVASSSSVASAVAPPVAPARVSAASARESASAASAAVAVASSRSPSLPPVLHGSVSSSLFYAPFKEMLVKCLFRRVHVARGRGSTQSNHSHIANYHDSR